MSGVGEGRSREVTEGSEYSAYVEAARKLQQQVVDLSKTLQAKANEKISELKDQDSDTFNELIAELKSYEEIVDDYSFSQEQRQRIAVHVERLRQMIEKFYVELGLLDMDERLQQMKLSINELLARDKRYEAFLRSGNVVGFADVDVWCLAPIYLNVLNAAVVAAF